MKFRLLFLLFFFFCNTQLFSQETTDSNFDSIFENRIKKVSAEKNMDKRFVLAKELAQLSEEKSSKKHISRVYVWLAATYMSKGISDSATYYYDGAIEIARDLELPNYFASAVIYSSHLRKQLGNIDKDARLIHEAIEKLEAYKEPNEKGAFYLLKLKYNLATLKINLGDLGGAKKEYLALEKICDDQNTLGNIYANMGYIYSNQQSLDSAIVYYKKARDLKEKLHDYRSVSTLTKNIGATYYKMKAYQNAEHYYLEAKALQEKNKDTRGLTSTYIALAGLARDLKDYTKQFKYLDSAKNKAEEIKNLKDLGSVYFQYILLYAKKDDIEKEDYYINKYFEIIEEKYDIEKTQIVSELETKYEVREKDNEIKFQKAAVAQQKKQKNIIIIAAIFIAITLFISLLLYRQRLKTQRLLHEKQQELNVEKMNHILDTHQLENIKAQVEGQHKERERIAKDLHDGIGGNIAAIKMKMEKLVEGQTKEINTIISNLEHTYDEVRTISHNLIPQKIKIQHFTDLLKQLIDFSINKNITSTHEFFPKNELDELPEEVQLTIYRILQELITNINKHSKANQVFINITLHETNSINVMVEDNGKGFDKGKTTIGIGLKGIKDRIEKYNGTLDIESNAKTGTLINININI